MMVTLAQSDAEEALVVVDFSISSNTRGTVDCSHQLWLGNILWRRRRRNIASALSVVRLLLSVLTLGCTS